MPVRILPRWLYALFLLLLVPPIAFAQNYKVEVLVADQGERERDRGYRLSLSSLLRTTLSENLVPEDRRQQVIRKAGEFVQSFRYRRFDSSKDFIRIATKKSREAPARASVLIVTFPADLERILESQLSPAPLTDAGPVADERILALIAVDQKGQRSLLGGTTGVKFQKRLRRLGSANQLEIVFPQLDKADSEAFSSNDIFTNRIEALDAAQIKYATGSRLVGALFRLSNGAWQSEWRFIEQGIPRDTINLTTGNLDEALIAVVDKMTDAGSVTTGGGFGLQSGVSARQGVAVRIENINSLRDYHHVREVLLSIDNQTHTEYMDPQAVVFRLTQADPYTLGDRLQRTGVLNVKVTQNTAVDRSNNQLNFLYSPR